MEQMTSSCGTSSLLLPGFQLENPQEKGDRSLSSLCSSQLLAQCQAPIRCSVTVCWFLHLHHSRLEPVVPWRSSSSLLLSVNTHTDHPGIFIICSSAPVGLQWGLIVHFPPAPSGASTTLCVAGIWWNAFPRAPPPPPHRLPLWEGWGDPEPEDDQSSSSWNVEGDWREFELWYFFKYLDKDLIWSRI